MTAVEPKRKSKTLKTFAAKDAKNAKKQLYVCNNVGRALPDRLQAIDIPRWWAMPTLKTQAFLRALCVLRGKKSF